MGDVRRRSTFVLGAVAPVWWPKTLVVTDSPTLTCLAPSATPWLTISADGLNQVRGTTALWVSLLRLGLRVLPRGWSMHWGCALRRMTEYLLSAIPAISCSPPMPRSSWIFLATGLWYVGIKCVRLADCATPSSPKSLHCAGILSSVHPSI